MVTKNKLLKINQGEDRNSLEATKLPSSWTARVRNEKLWMGKATIYSESFYLGLGKKHELYPTQKQEKTCVPRIFGCTGRMENAWGACECTPYDDLGAWYVNSMP